MARFEDLYSVLGVRQDADEVVITAAYKSLAKKYHPDTSGSANPINAEMFRLIQKAYDKLRDIEQRHLYDEKLTERARQKAHKQRAESKTSSDGEPRQNSTKNSGKTRQYSGNEADLNPPSMRWTRNSYITAAMGPVFVLLFILSSKFWIHKTTTIDLSFTEKPMVKNLSSPKAMSASVLPNKLPLMLDNPKKVDANQRVTERVESRKITDRLISEKDLEGSDSYPTISKKNILYPEVVRTGKTDASPDLKLIASNITTIPELIMITPTTNKDEKVDLTTRASPQSGSAESAHPNLIGSPPKLKLQIKPGNAVEGARINSVAQDKLKSIQDSLGTLLAAVAESETKNDSAFQKSVKTLKFDPSLVTSPILSPMSSSDTALYLIDAAIQFLKENKKSDKGAIIETAKSQLQSSVKTHKASDVVWYSYMLRNALQHNSVYTEFSSGTAEKTFSLHLEKLPASESGKRKENYERIVGSHEILDGQLIPVGNE